MKRRTIPQRQRLKRETGRRHKSLESLRKQVLCLQKWRRPLMQLKKAKTQEPTKLSSSTAFSEKRATTLWWFPKTLPSKGFKSCWMWSMERKRHKVTWMQVYNLQGTHSTHIQMYMYGKIKGTYTCGTFLGKQIVMVKGHVPLAGNHVGAHFEHHFGNSIFSQKNTSYTWALAWFCISRFHEKCPSSFF